ncbi:hypothetical protein VTN00DRAFT_6692 [Thermoascus crustaceus]|uniref:uncharacterized protein n=1 Tax=Thermoascus crustaceus TaxID=5088 RepID=UPI00374335F9
MGLDGAVVEDDVGAIYLHVYWLSATQDRLSPRTVPENQAASLCQHSRKPIVRTWLTGGGGGVEGKENKGVEKDKSKTGRYK